MFDCSFDLLNIFIVWIRLEPGRSHSCKRGQGGVLRQLDNSGGADLKTMGKRITGASPEPSVPDGDGPTTGDASELSDVGPSRS